MTIRVMLKNADSTRLVVVAGTFNGQTQDTKTLKPGEESEFWVHSTRDLHVSEGEIAVPAPAPTAPT